MKPLLLLFVSLLTLQLTRAQVSVQVLIPPPYSPYLYDYQEQFASRNAILLTNTSRQAVTLMLRGELTGRTNGVRVYTSPNYRPARPIDLQPGQSQRFTLAEGNQDYLDRKNLEVAGVDNATQTQILTTGLLPPGSYDLCLLAYRYDNGQPVGTPYRGCTVLNITYLEPPRLVQPTCGRDLLIRPNEPNQTLFSWTPPVGNIGGAQLTYDFYLVKVPPGQNPNDAINNAIDRRVGNPFIERDLTTTFLNYGVAEPPLTEGDYAWRVIARDPDGRTAFQNQGRSNYCTFTTRNVATPPVIDRTPALVQTPTKPNLPIGPMRTLKAVAPGVSPCADVTGPADNAPVAGNYQNQTVKIGKFDLTIDDIAADGGGYTGKGRIRWNGVPVRVSFTTIQVNAGKQVIAGYANGIDDAFREPGVDLTSGNLTDLSNLTGPAVQTYVDHLKNNMIEQGKAAIAVPLPLGYDAGSGLIGINYMRFTPTGADMGLVFNMEMPEANSYLALAGVGICMDPDRLIPNNALLYLLKDFTVPFTPLTFKTGNLAPANPTGTFAELTAADGLKRIHGELALNLGSSMLQLDDGNGNVLPGDVTATLTTDFTKWADWVADVRLPPAFTLAPLAGFTLKGVSVQYDHSDLRNTPAFAPPTEYTGERGPTFQGLYLNDLQVLLPKAFAGQTGNRTGFAAKNCLFASGEFTGRLAPATNPLLDYNVGSMGNWGFSIDDFEILFVQNRFERGGMNGKIQFPISTDYFTYTTTLRDNLKNLQFVVQPKPGGYTIPLWAADMSLEETSHILVGLQNSNPVMDMKLNGKIQINTAKVSTAVALALPKLFFENFTVSNQNSPGAASGGGVYVNPGSWKLVGGIFRDTPSDAPAPGARSGGPFAPDAPEPGWAPGNDGGLAGFPIEIAPPKAVANANGMGVELGAYVSLGEASANIMQANGFVQILGKITLDGKRPKPAFGGVYPTRFGIKGSFGGGEVSAAIDLYHDDATYGNGFRGVGQVKIPALATVEATVQFGKVSGFYYAYADASVILATGIPVAPPTPLVLNGVKGGFYYNMAPVNWVTPTTITTKTAPQKPTPGYTNSGVSYRPQRGGWGIKAGVYMALADPHLLTSLVEVEASFNGTALSMFSLTGKANVLDTDGDLNTPDNAMVRADATFKHDVAQKSYVFGAGVSGKFLSTTFTIPIDAYFDPHNWHVKIGDPYGTKMSATLIDFDEGPIKAYLGASAYVAFGNDLSGIPPLPDLVATFLATGENPTTADAVQQQRQSEFGAVNASEQSNVLGETRFKILLGAGLKGNLRIKVLVLAVHADAEVGFDAALSFGQKCGGNNSPAAGLNGWYGTAQLYAYLSGSIDIHVDLFGIADGDFRLCALSAGALFQGGVPNPTWGDGRVRATGEVLGGLVSFDASAHVAFGEKCQPVYPGDPLAKLIIIQELRPTTGATNVATDQTLSAVFNVSMNQEYTVQLPDKSTRTYRFGLGQYSLTYVDAGGKQQSFYGLAAPVWANNSQLLLLKMNSGQLPSRRPHTFSVTATIEQQQPNGSFAFVTDGSGNRRTETKTVSFTTGEQPDEIRFKDVAYQYPLNGQLYCLKGPFLRGLVAGPLPNEALTKPGYRYEAVFVPKDAGPSLRVPFSYQTGNERYPSRVVFALPAGLQNEKTYRLELHRISPISTMLLSVRLASQAGIREGTRQVVSNQNAIQGRAVTRQNMMVGQLSGSNLVADKILYAFPFHTSRYNTFAEKMNALQFTPTAYTNSSSIYSASYLTFELAPGGRVENFEDSELFGYRSAKGWVPAMLNPQPLPPISTEYPHEAWVAQNVYNPLFEFVMGGVSRTFNWLPEREYSGWLLNYPAAAMQAKRGQYVLPFDQRPITSVLGRSPIMVTGVKAAPAAKAIQSIGKQFILPTAPVLVSARLLDPFALNAEPTRGYKFFVQRDRISFYDWQAVDQFGTDLYTARAQELAMREALQKKIPFKIKFTKLLKDIDVWANSPTLTLEAKYDHLRDMPNDLINRYPVPTGLYFGTGRDFIPRAGGSTSAVVLTYTPFPDAAYEHIRKPFLFKATPPSTIYVK